jgi:hypothetical protein
VTCLILAFGISLAGDAPCCDIVDSSSTPIKFL